MKAIQFKTGCFIAACFAALSGTSQAAGLPMETINSLSDQVYEDVVRWRRDFHEHPELSNREFRTAGIVANHLRALGIEVQTGVAHTGVVGVLKGGRPGPVVMLRADMDGLPVTERVDLPFASVAIGEYNGEEVGVMHACGHDTHVAIMMGVAEVLTEMRDEIPGTVKFVFQPAEEGAPLGEEGGGELMVKEGVLKNPDVDVAFALHIDALLDAGRIGYKPGAVWASVDDYKITVWGRQSHGAAPWMGVDTVVTSAQIISALQTVISRNLEITKAPGIVTVGSIHGGVRSNIIPEKVELLGTIRALDPKGRELIHQRVREIAENVAASMGARVDVKIPYSSSYPVTINDPELTMAMLPALEAAAGPENLDLIHWETGAEDFSYFANEVPGFYFTLGGKIPGQPRAETADHHTPDFYVDERGLGVGVKALTTLTLDYMNQHPQ